MWLRFRKIVLDILFPIPELPENIRLNDTLFCSTCRARLPENKKTCHKNAEYILSAATAYDSEVKKMIWQMKYRNRAALASPLSELVIRYLENCKLDIENFLVIPIPASRERLRERGYNQAELIATRVADKFVLEMATTTLVRQSHARPQAEVKGWRERKENISGCFGVAEPTLIAGRNIILIDDVHTSGATMSEAAHQLKDFGAKKIIGLVIAKAG